MPVRFLDTNVLVRYFARDDEEKAQRALALLHRIEQGEEKVSTSPMVIFETVFTLQHTYRVPKDRIRDLMLPIVTLRGLQLPGKALFSIAFDLYVAKNISFVDAFNVAYMRQQDLAQVYSWDTDFDRIPGIQRIEP